MSHPIRNLKSAICTRRSMMPPRLRGVVAGFTFAVVIGGTALALSGGVTYATPPMARADGAPVVVELFTSQSCYSCPPAEARLADLARRDGIVALEHHVDYWDSLVYGSAGRGKDVFSSSEATARQRAYNEMVQRRIAKTVLVDETCHSYFQTETGKVTTQWPGFMSEYLFRTWRVKRRDYEFG